MPTLSVADFCQKHGACCEGRQWALDHCDTMTDVWATAQPAWLVWVATRPGVLTDCELRLFACWSVRQIWHLLTDERSRNAVEVAERFAEGLATEKELAAVSAAARAAARAAADATARAAACAAAYAAACAAVYAAARAAADAAARAAACAAAYAAAYAAARAAQAQWLRKNVTPNFDAE